MSIIECYRFVRDDLTSANGNLSWRIGEWNEVSGTIVCCAHGLHAAPTPRDSVRNVYGQRWFAAEARGETSHQGTKFAAREMRLVEEIPPDVLRHFAVGCAKRSFGYLEQRHPVDARIRQCIEVTEGFLDGALGEDDLREGRQAAGAVIADPATGPDTGRLIAAAMAASQAADGDAASWTAAAAGAAHAANLAADAIDAAAALTTAYAEIHNVAKGFAAANIAEQAATAARTAAASGAVAHAAAVAAARGTYAPDTAADAYFAAWSATTVRPADYHYLAQNAHLLELIAGTRAKQA
ncbi:DUF7666 domain-containing protein [Amycolatopsis sp. NBC_01480]|uniref:DUF7666 domain-containing protein n=1 Tax=Amycolatopsis sp. NBC_01480 TaxID=2903562 RepID=UPI002E2A04FD|nr:hypothetical protein [Amycolatopsis sp. NBC_01480]